MSCRRPVRLLLRFLKCDQGAAALEFAIVSVPLFFIIMAGVEFGLITYTQEVVESALTETAREASIGYGIPLGTDRVSYIVSTMQSKIQGLPNNSKATVTAAVVTAPGTSPTADQDICSGPNPYPPSCEPPLTFTSPQHHANYVPPSAGTSGQLVEIRVTYPWEILTPLIRPAFSSGIFTISSTVVIKNEPF